MRTIKAKDFLNVPAWQANKATKQAKRALHAKRKQRNNKRLIWANAE